ncbi:MAG: fibronectin type III domain-containing protein, partial [Candidatus Kerfeldbacteria bacterium]|nr:fibronectin type III domain-containing protein [Candidatus Kerfeldbacteria bacterium]
MMRHILQRGLVLATGLFLASSVAASAATVATGSVVYPDGTGVSDFQMDLIASDGGTVASGVTNSLGVYSITLTDTSTILSQQISVRLGDDAPNGYTLPALDSFFFTYNGSTQTVATFTLNEATKFIDVTVIDDQGDLRELDVMVTPLFQTLNSGVSEHVGSTATLTVAESGKYLVTGDCDLSSQASQCPFINISGGQVVEFVEADDVVETVAVTIMLTFAPTVVTGQFLDADGNNIYQPGGFQADITFTGYNKDYGILTTRRKVGFDGIATVRLIPGVWTALPSTGELGAAYETQTFYPTDATFVLTRNDSDPTAAQAYDFGTVQAQTNVATIRGSLQEVAASPTGFGAAIQAVSDVEVVATNAMTRRSYSDNSDHDGTFTLSGLPYGDYAVTIRSTDGYVPAQSAYTAVSADAPDASDVIVDVIATDVVIGGNVTKDGAVQSYLPAIVKATDSVGHTYTAAVDQDGAYELNVPSDQLSSDTLELVLVTQQGADVFLEQIESVEVSAGQTITQDLAVSDDEATLSGVIKNFSGDTMTTELGDRAKVMAINHDTGSVEEVAVGDDGTWTMEVGSGDWQIIPQVTDPAAGVIANDMSSKEVTVDAGDTKTDVALKVQETVGTVSGTLTDADDVALSEVPVVFTNLPALQEAAAQAGTTIDQSKVVEVSTSTASDGSYSQDLPAGEFTAYFMSNPEITSLVEPASDTFTIKADKEVTVDGVYQEAGKSISGDVGDSFASVSVIAYNPDSGMQELTVDAETNEFSGDLTAGDWTIVTAGIKNDKLWTDETVVTVAGNNTSYDPALENTGVVMPAAVSVSASMTSGTVVSNTAGATVSIPAYAAGTSGSMTVELVPDPQVVVNGGTAQVGLAYDVNITDSTSDRSISQLYRPMTVSLPIDDALAAGASADEISAAFYDPQLEAYLSDGMTGQTDGNQLVMTTTHLTRFSATTISTLADDLPVKPRKPAAKKIQDTTAQATWKKPKASTVTYYQVQTRPFGSKVKKHWKTYKSVLDTKKVLKNLEATTKYDFRVKACNNTGCSAYT